MPLHRLWPTARVFALAAAVAAALSGCGADGPASYVGKASNAAIYVSWTRTDDALSGQITQALLDEDPSSGEVETNRASFTGTADGSAVSIVVDRGLGSTSTITGTLKDSTLKLSYPSPDGGVTPITFKSGGDAEYNQALAALRSRASDAKAEADEAEREADAQKAGTDAAAAVTSALASLDQAADNATASSPDLYESDLATVQAGLDTVKSDYEVVTQAVDNGYNDTICDDAESIADDVASMKRDIGTMHADRAQNRSSSSIGSDITTLRTRLRELQEIDSQYRPGDAPTKADVDAAIAAARAKVRKQGGEGADFGAAEKLLEQAQALKAKADDACNRLGQ